MKEGGTEWRDGETAQCQDQVYCTEVVLGGGPQQESWNPYFPILFLTYKKMSR
jgi:hypothetical protein